MGVGMCLDVEVEQRMGLVLEFQALKVEEEVEVDTQLPVDGLLPEELGVVDEKVQFSKVSILTLLFMKVRE